MRHLDRDLKLIAISALLYGLGAGLYVPLLFVHALDLGASRGTLGLLNALMLGMMAIGNVPGAWAARRFRLKPVIVGVWWLAVPTALTFLLAPSWPWLIPGLLLSGLYFANNPALKSYIYLKSEPSRVAGNLTLIVSAYPLGLIVAPLAGGFLAEQYGMRPVFAVALVMYVLSSSVLSFIRDTPYHSADAPLSLTALRRNRRFRRYLVFFLAGFLAVYVGQAFLSPYLSQVHHQGWTALGVYSSLAALGTALMTSGMGRLTDLRGPRVGIGGVLLFLMVGALLLLVGWNPVVWGVAMLFCGAFESLRFVASGIVGDSFEGMPLAWGYAIFDTLMGIPMAGGAVLGGLLYRTAYSLPFVLVIAVSAVLLLLLVAGHPRRVGRSLSGSGREGAHARD